MDFKTHRRAGEVRAGVLRAAASTLLKPIQIHKQAIASGLCTYSGMAAAFASGVHFVPRVPRGGGRASGEPPRSSGVVDSRISTYSGNL